LRRTRAQTLKADRERKNRLYATDSEYRKKIVAANKEHYHRRKKDPVYLAHRRELERAAYLRRPKTPEAIEERRIRDWGRRQIGWTPERYKTMLAEQDGLCASCGDAFITSPHCDHDHVTHRPRALLCASCNRGIGMFKDDPDRLQAAVHYLRSWSLRGGVSVA